MPRRSHLSVEQLEDRCVPAMFGNPWPDAGHLSLSFAPDGTSVVGSSSSLYSTLNSSQAAAGWETQVLRAFQTWLQHGNISLSVASDNGTALGSPGLIQGQAGIGDIRVAARPLSPSILSITTPFDLYDSWSGEVLLNSMQPWGGMGFDLFSVMLQEAGHSLGVGNSTDLNSPMYDDYAGVRTGLTAGDIASLQALYGARTPDRFEGIAGNETSASAAQIRFVTSVSDYQGLDPTAGDLPWVARGDLTANADVDVYKVLTPEGASAFTVALRTSGVSLLTARVSVYNSAGTLLATAAASDPRSGDLSLTLTGVSALSTYTIKVERAGGDFGVGGYRLAAGYQALQAVATQPVTSLINPDGSRANNLNQAHEFNTASGADPRIDYFYQASIGGEWDSDFYKIRAPASSTGPMALTAMVWALEANTLDPVLSVLDVNGQTLPVQVISSGAGSFTLQLDSVTADAVYYLKVSADPQNGHTVGNYSISANFAPPQEHVKTFSSDTLTQVQREDYRTMHAAESQLFTFQLEAQYEETTATAAGVRMVIYNSLNQRVFTLEALAGETVQGDLLLAPGTYTVRFIGVTANGDPLPLLSYALRGQERSDSEGVGLVDPTGNPTGTPPPPPPTLEPAYSFGEFEGDLTLITALILLDPYSNPWW